MGNTGRNVLRGPGQRNLDFSVIKHFAITEKRNIEWRSEFFNIFNITNFVNPGNNISTANTFGVISGKSGNKPRIIQFALKLNF